MNKILFIDTLTTGMNVDKCSIYRLGGIYTENGREIKRFLLNMCPFPGARINDESLWVGKVDRSIIAHYPSQEEAFSQFLEMLNEFEDVRNIHDKIYIAGFNASAMDALFLWRWFRNNANPRSRDYFYMQVIDVMTIAALDLMDQRWKMHDFSLESVAKKLHIYPGEGDTSDCIQNAKVCLDIYRHYREKFGLEQFPDKTETENKFFNTK